MQNYLTQINRKIGPIIKEKDNQPNPKISQILEYSKDLQEAIITMSSGVKANTQRMGII